MVVRKRTTTKTGKFTKSTRTLSSTGKVTYSSSSKPPGSLTRRTISSSGGKIRTTHSTKLGGGYTNVTTKTKTLVSKPRSSGTRRRSSGVGNISFLDLLILPFLPFIWTYRLIVWCIQTLLSPWFWAMVFGVFVVFLFI